VAVRVRCPQCGSSSQVAQEHLGRAVRCPHCGQAFPATSAETTTPSPATHPPQPATEGGSGGFWSGLKGVVRSWSAPSVKTASLDPEAELELRLDGPAAVGELAPAVERPGSKGRGLEIGSASSPGRVRPRNEDSFLVHHLSWANLDQRHESALIVVADGMGGYEAGDRASRLVIQHVGETVAPLLARAMIQPLTPEEIETVLEKSLKSANQLVHQQSQSDPACKGMGATAAVVVIADQEVRVGHVGDCRVYHFHAAELQQVTRDQTLVARMVELGKLTPEEARSHPQRNEVTQAVGKHADLHPEPYKLRLEAGDWLLVASDGLHTHVDEAALTAALLQTTESAAALAEHLVDLADQGGGADNCTVVAVHRG
jgi:PPM family protein phosphatase